jgi:DGQHR domain-containing protein
VSGQQILRLAALRVEQRADVPLYIFGVNGRVIHQFATVNFAERAADGVLSGYQRTRVDSHIAQIRTYLSQEGALLPNAIVVAFDGEVIFVPTEGAIRRRWGTPGILKVPLPGPREKKPGLIVDGQQRVSALAQLPPDRQFPVVVVSFSSLSVALQREQFVLVNKTKPLPRDLLNELLPHVDTQLPRPWQLRRVSGKVVELLRWDKESPFYGRVRGVGSSGEGSNISQAAVLGVIETSIRRGGVLALHYAGDGVTPDVEEMARIVRVFFTGVQRAWPYAWGGNPWNSRLVHGVGISALGSLMDVIMKEVDAEGPRAISSVTRRLKKLDKVAAWTDGRWEGLNCGWDQLQNTSQDKRRLAQYLVSEYLRVSKSSATARRRGETSDSSLGLTNAGFAVDTSFEYVNKHGIATTHTIVEISDESAVTDRGQRFKLTTLMRLSEKGTVVPL